MQPAILFLVAFPGRNGAQGRFPARADRLPRHHSRRRSPNTFVSSMNATIDLGTSRKAALHTRVSSEVFDTSIIYVLITAVIVGYVTRTGARASAAG